jgi:hypothetical protein
MCQDGGGELFWDLPFVLIACRWAKHWLVICCWLVLGHWKMWLWVSIERLQDGQFGVAVLLMQRRVSPIGSHL